jgi:hypothetical protein
LGIHALPKEKREIFLESGGIVTENAVKCKSNFGEHINPGA